MTSSDAALRAPVIVGPGRVGRSLALAIDGAEIRGRADGLDGIDGRTVLLCVPDSAIVDLAAQIGRSGRCPALIGHTSGATGLEPLAAAGAGGEFSVHPLQTVPDGETDLNGSPAAVAGTSPAALDVAKGIAARTGMKPFVIAEEHRVLYHAAASIASNFLVSLEQTAADLLGGIAVDEPREVLAPLVRRSLENWVERGPDALTGPIARGDESTVAAHREALSEARPDLLAFYDALAERTRGVAIQRAA
jgi:predicted short-subunit dehydrogenase-like oxidoreductase (DUF2520 family)